MRGLAQEVMTGGGEFVEQVREAHVMEGGFRASRHNSGFSNSARLSHLGCDGRSEAIGPSKTSILEVVGNERDKREPGRIRRAYQGVTLTGTFKLSHASFASLQRIRIEGSAAVPLPCLRDCTHWFLTSFHTSPSALPRSTPSTLISP